VDGSFQFVAQLGAGLGVAVGVLLVNGRTVCGSEMRQNKLTHFFHSTTILSYFLKMSSGLKPRTSVSV
jgi:hypothetical protein